MADNNEIDDIINEVRAKKERLDNGENPFAEIAEEKPEVTEDEFTINISEKSDGDTEEPPVQSDYEADVQADEEPAPEEETAQSEESFVINDDTEEKVLEPELNEEMMDGSFGDELDEEAEAKAKKKKTIIVCACVALIVIIAVVLAFVLNKPEPEPVTTTEATTVTTTEAPKPIVNPLTGEADYNTDAVGKRPVAIVVENSPAARPQWGINDSEHAPDIILEGEVEGGITRMLWFYADYTAVAAEVGPIRSARPPFVRFSERFDSIFIHWGMSNTTGDYIGADSVFIDDDVDHINQMSYNDSVGLFGRDYNGKSGEHTGIVHGDKVAAAIEAAEFRTDAENYTKFNFYDKAQKVSDTACSSVTLTYSSRSNSTSWSYNESDGKYHSSAYGTDVARDNLLVLFDNTEYIAKSNYKGSGSSEIYCNYNFDGGSGKYISNGTVIDITWEDNDGTIILKDENGKALSLNPGKIWIGWGSANNGGSVTVE